MIKLNEQVLYDIKGKKKSVLLNYRDYEALLEDYYDLAVIASRKDEKTLSHDEVTKRLKRDGFL